MPTIETQSTTLMLCRDLMTRESVTPEDAGCQALMMTRLEACGFVCEPMRFGDVDNFWASRGETEPTLIFAGHTDVVPTGPEDHWQSPPFTPVERDGLLFGRGAADMKSSLAAMIVATEEFVANFPQHRGRIAFLITADEEGPAVDGTTRVVEALRERGERPAWCIVGEPSSSTELGDTVKNGRRGSLNGQLMVRGRQGHIAYPHLADNPMHRAFAALNALVSEVWDTGNQYFEPTSLQFSNLQSGTGASNVIPGTLSAQFNIRFNDQWRSAQLQQRCAEILDSFALDYRIDWSLSGEPFITEPGELLAAVEASIATHTGLKPQLSTGGGTSDGRFIATLGTQIIELGPVNASIHQVDEHVRIADLDRLKAIYYDTLVGLLGSP